MGKKSKCERKGGSWVDGYEKDDGIEVESHCRGADV